MPCFVLRKIQQKFYLVLRVRPGNAYGVPDIVRIGTEKVVIVEVIVLCDLPRPLAAKIGVWGVADVVFPKLLLRRRVDRVAPAVPDFFRAGGGGGDFKPVGYAAFLDEVLEDELGDGGAADIAIADEEDFYHGFVSPCFAPECPVLQGFLGL